jgi:uncharacterized membrane protein (TIGR02234 family)
MTSSQPARLRRRPRQELAVVLLLGVAGAGLVLLAMRQGWAQVTTAAPKPLPAGTAIVTGQDLVPAADALAVAAIASLAAVLATRRVARRVAGIVLAGFGAAIAAAVSVSISAADVLGAAAGSAGPGVGSGPDSGPGSVTSGAAQGASGAPLTGFPAHPTLATLPWRGAAVAGALIIVAAGILVTWRAERLPVMSGRYDRPARPAAPAAAPAAGPAQPGGDHAWMWDSLSQGEDPTAERPRDGSGQSAARPAEPGEAGRDDSGESGNTGIGTAAEPGQGAVTTTQD